jgi:Protein ChrB, N-terminal
VSTPVETVQQRLDATRNRGVRVVVAVRDGGHLRPVLDAHAVERRAERDDAVGRDEIVGAERARPIRLDRDAGGTQSGQHRRRDLRVGARPARERTHRAAPRGGAVLEQCRGDHALGGAVLADEEDGGNGTLYSETMVAHEPERIKWALLAYRLPREPSTPRIAVWRKLRRLGVAQLQDGLVALPLDNRNREQLEWLADEVREAGGEATLWLSKLASRSEERALVARMRSAVAADYARVTAAAAGAGADRRTLARLRRELHRLRLRDYFPSPERQRAQRAVERLAARIEERAA